LPPAHCLDVAASAAADVACFPEVVETLGLGTAQNASPREQRPASRNLGHWACIREVPAQGELPPRTSTRVVLLIAGRYRRERLDLPASQTDVLVCGARRKPGGRRPVNRHHVVFPPAATARWQHRPHGQLCCVLAEGEKRVARHSRWRKSVCVDVPCEERTPRFPWRPLVQGSREGLADLVPELRVLDPETCHACAIVEAAVHSRWWTVGSMRHPQCLLARNASTGFL